ncbi:hypothetical protein NP92_12940 [Anoxybacillus gonensis]|nr:hypothetical protein AFK25_13495 [Anoxybacillus gonensis]KGP59647.1 hypothetical protein NP92_12940 [Anoxybacillus gonensis]
MTKFTLIGIEKSRTFGKMVNRWKTTCEKVLLFQQRKTVQKMVDTMHGKNYNVVCSHSLAKFKSFIEKTYISLKFS